MGGKGSGSCAKRVTVESAFKLELAALLDKASLYPRCKATMFREGGRICGAIERIDVETEIGPESGWVRLRYDATNHREDVVHVDDRIDIVSMAQPYGGRRWWFVCPYLGCRVKALFLPEGATRFASRQKWRLTYQSSRLSPEDRALATEQNIRMSLGGEDDGFGDFPDRPSGMRHKRYEKLKARAEAASKIGTDAFYAWLGKFDVKDEKHQAKA